MKKLFHIKGRIGVRLSKAQSSGIPFLKPLGKGSRLDFLRDFINTFLNILFCFVVFVKSNVNNVNVNNVNCQQCQNVRCKKICSDLSRSSQTCPDQLRSNEICLILSKCQSNCQIVANQVTLAGVKECEKEKVYPKQCKG